MIQNIKKYAKQHGLVFVLLESLMDLDWGISVYRSGQAKYLLESHTRLLDLTHSNEELLSDMKQKGRYNIKIAEKNGCIAHHVPSNSENIDIFYRMLQDTTDRDGFSANKKSYYEHLLAHRKYVAEGLYFVYWQDQVIAAAILIISGSTAVYYYGASTSHAESRRLMAPYLLQWEMIQSSKKAGCSWYDFLGIAPE